MRQVVSIAIIAGFASGVMAQIEQSAYTGGQQTGGVYAGNVLWDQSNFDEGVSSLVDQSFPDFPDFSAFLVNDVVVGAGGWSIDSITTYFTIAGNQNGADAWPDAGNAILNIFPKTGGLPEPGDDPTGGLSVPVSFSNVTDLTQAVTASGLGIDLAPGEYWIGLTPDLDFAVFDQEFHRAAPIVGMDTAFRNPGGGFGVGADWQDTGGLGAGDWPGAYDSAILIQGVPAPGAVALLGFGGLFAARRRR